MKPKKRLNQPQKERRERKKPVVDPKLLALRDEIIKAYILNTLPLGDLKKFDQTAHMLDEAFRKGAHDWKTKYLPVLSDKTDQTT